MVLGNIDSNVVSTFAWFVTATASDAVAVDPQAGTLTAGQSTAEAQSLYFSATAVVNGNVALTTSDGYTFGYSGNSLVPAAANVSNPLYNSITLGTTGWFKDNGLSQDADSDAIALIAAEDIPFTIQGGARTRLSFTEPSGNGTDQANFAASSFGSCGVNNTLNLRVHVEEGGAKTIQYNAGTQQNPNWTAITTIYFSIAGQVTAQGADMTKSQVETAVAGGTITKDASTSLDQTLTIDF